LNHESIDLLSSYLRIDTTNPPGNEDKGVAFFSEILDKEKISYKTYEPTSSRRSLRAYIPGSGEKEPLILLNHIDVVPANNDQWVSDPFGGELKDGYIYGRGALDMKSLGIMQFLSFLEINRKKTGPKRDIVFLAVADEEADGKNGVDFLFERHPNDLNAGLVLNEGGYVTNDLLTNRTAFLVSTAEKGACWLRLKRKGTPGHGSLPHSNNALEMLILGINRLLLNKPQPVITNIVAQFFEKIGDDLEGLKPYLQDGKAETLLRCLEDTGWIEKKHISAMITNTMSVNVLNAGVKTNVIPDQAEAELDVRLLPGQDPDNVINEINRVIDDRDIEISFIEKGIANSSPINSEIFSIIESAIHQNYPEAIVVPSLDFGNSDSRFFREKGITAYGVNPILLTAEDLELIHGHDERISIENMIKGTDIYRSIVMRLC
jgi:acetylornithine deacetylase/succinyl-diaminopimelate desuccinylase-like protein